MDLGALAGFITAFQAALRELDRHERGEPARKPGTPEAEASAAAALRLVSLRPGSAIAELEPMRTADDDQQLALSDPPRARLVIDRLLECVEHGSALPADVAGSLERARRACGDDGAFDVSTSPTTVARTVHFDRTVIAGLASASPAPAPVTSVSGRLTRLQESPDTALIRSPDGTDWTAKYAPELAADLQPLWRHNVYASGEGERTSPRKGTFTLDSIAPLLDDAQTELFTAEHIDTETLLARQGIGGPQGLDSVGASALFDDETEDAYLAAILGDET